MDFSLQVSALMDKFEQQFEHLDVQSSYMETAMSDTTTLTVPQVRFNSYTMLWLTAKKVVGFNWPIPMALQVEKSTRDATFQNWRTAGEAIRSFRDPPPSPRIPSIPYRGSPGNGTSDLEQVWGISTTSILEQDACPLQHKICWYPYTWLEKAT